LVHLDAGVTGCTDFIRSRPWPFGILKVREIENIRLRGA
jgi:hypothetical protein